MILVILQVFFWAPASKNDGADCYPPLWGQILAQSFCGSQIYVTSPFLSCYSSLLGKNLDNYAFIQCCTHHSIGQFFYDCFFKFLFAMLFFVFHLFYTPICEFCISVVGHSWGGASRCKLAQLIFWIPLVPRKPCFRGAGGSPSNSPVSASPSPTPSVTASPPSSMGCQRLFGKYWTSLRRRDQGLVMVGIKAHRREPQELHIQNRALLFGDFSSISSPVQVLCLGFKTCNSLYSTREAADSRTPPPLRKHPRIQAPKDAWGCYRSRKWCLRKGGHRQY